MIVGDGWIGRWSRDIHCWRGIRYRLGMDAARVSSRSRNRVRHGSDADRVSGGSDNGRRFGRNGAGAGDSKAAIIVSGFVGIVIERQNRKMSALPDVPVIVIERTGPGSRICEPRILRQAGLLHGLTDGARTVDPDFVFGASTAHRSESCRHPAEILLDRA